MNCFFYCDLDYLYNFANIIEKWWVHTIHKIKNKDFFKQFIYSVNCRSRISKYLKQMLVLVSILMGL